MRQHNSVSKGAVKEKKISSEVNKIPEIFHKGKKELDNVITEGKLIKTTSKKKYNQTIIQSNRSYEDAYNRIFKPMVRNTSLKNTFLIGDVWDNTTLTLRNESTSKSGPTLDYNDKMGHIYKIRLLNETKMEVEKEMKNEDDEIEDHKREMN